MVVRRKTVRAVGKLASKKKGNKRKKSVRLMIQDYQKKLDKKAKYIWPRTVEVAKSPFEDRSGLNKMFYLVACDLFPEKKIIQPLESDSEDENEDNFVSDVEIYEKTGHRPSTSRNNRNTIQNRTNSKPRKRRRTNSLNEDDLSWRSQHNRRSNANKSKKERLEDASFIDDVITSVVERFRCSLG